MPRHAANGQPDVGLRQFLHVLAESANGIGAGHVALRMPAHPVGNHRPAGLLVHGERILIGLALPAYVRQPADRRGAPFHQGRGLRPHPLRSRAPTRPGQPSPALHAQPTLFAEQERRDADQTAVAERRPDDAEAALVLGLHEVRFRGRFAIHHQEVVGVHLVLVEHVAVPIARASVLDLVPEGACRLPFVHVAASVQHESDVLVPRLAACGAELAVLAPQPQHRSGPAGEQVLLERPVPLRQRVLPSREEFAQGLLFPLAHVDQVQMHGVVHEHRIDDAVGLFQRVEIREIRRHLELARRQQPRRQPPHHLRQNRKHAFLPGPPRQPPLFRAPPIRIRRRCRLKPLFRLPKPEIPGEQLLAAEGEQRGAVVQRMRFVVGSGHRHGSQARRPSSVAQSALAVSLRRLLATGMLGGRTTTIAVAALAQYRPNGNVAS